MMRFLQTAFPEFKVRGEGKSSDGSRWVHVGTQETYIALSPAKTEPDKRWAPYRGVPGVNHLGSSAGRTGRSIAFESDEIALQKLRGRLHQMSDEELIKFGKTVRGLSAPRVGVNEPAQHSTNGPQ